MTKPRDRYRLTRAALIHPFWLAINSGLLLGAWSMLLFGSATAGILSGLGIALIQLILWAPKIGLIRNWASGFVDD